MKKHKKKRNKGRGERERERLKKQIVSIEYNTNNVQLMCLSVFEKGS